MVKAPRATPSPRALRPLNLPEPLSVEATEGWPNAVEQGNAGHTIASIEDLWRVEEEWWRDSPIVRTYFEVILDSGRRMTLFHDQVNGGWYTQRHG